MNNTQSLPVIFWCFIVLITCCFSLHLRLDPPETSPKPPPSHSFLASARWRSEVSFVLPFRWFLLLLPDFPSFTISAQLHVGLGRVFFLHNQKEAVSITCITFMPHSPPSPVPLLTPSSLCGIQNCKDINTTTSIHSACPSTFFAIQFRAFTFPLHFVPRFYFMKCFDSTIFKLASLISTTDSLLTRLLHRAACESSSRVDQNVLSEASLPGLSSCLPLPQTVLRLPRSLSKTNKIILTT
jgi:hypothetical protein